MKRRQHLVQIIGLIRAALKQQGYSLRKHPRKSVSTIQVNSDKHYQAVSHQRLVAAPRGWRGRSPTGADHHSNHPQSANHRFPYQSPMTYLDQLHPWCIIRFLPSMQRRVIARFRRRNDAEAHMKILRQHASTLHYSIIFDPATTPLSQSTAQQPTS